MSENSNLKDAFTNAHELVKHNNLNEAIEQLTEILKHDSRNINALSLLIEIYIKQNNIVVMFSFFISFIFCFFHFSTKSRPVCLLKTAKRLLIKYTPK